MANSALKGVELLRGTGEILMAAKPYKFTAPRKALLLKLVSEGKTRSAAMESLGLARQTLTMAMKRDPEFAALVEAAQMPVHEAVESALLKSALSLCNRVPGRWQHVNQVRVDTKVDVHVGAEQALQAKIMGMAQLAEPEDVR